MKKLTLIFALGLLLLTSCSKDESLEQTELQKVDSVYVLNQLNNIATWNIVELEAPIRSSNHSNNTIQTNGHYQPISRNDMMITWSGEQNGYNGRGSAEIIQINPNFSFHFILETECVMVEGNQAVYGGTITQVREISGDAPEIGVGWRFYFKVIDSGNVENTNYDQIANITFFASPRSISLCNVYLPTHDIWSSQGYSDVIIPGFVEVRN